MNHTSIHPVSQSVTKASSMTSQSVISHHIMTTSPPNITHTCCLFSSSATTGAAPVPLPLSWPKYSLHIRLSLPPVPLHPAARMVFLSVGYCLSCKRKETLRKCMCVCHLCKKKHRRGKPKTSVINTYRSWVGKLL